MTTEGKLNLKIQYFQVVGLGKIVELQEDIVVIRVRHLFHQQF